MKSDVPMLRPEDTPLPRVPRGQCLRADRRGSIEICNGPSQGMVSSQGQVARAFMFEKIIPQITSTVERRHSRTGPLRGQCILSVSGTNMLGPANLLSWDITQFPQWRGEN
jgi:hypothetical protein